MKVRTITIYSKSKFLCNKNIIANIPWMSGNNAPIREIVQHIISHLNECVTLVVTYLSYILSYRR